MDVLRIENVLKRFGDYIAVNKVSFSTESGTVLGLLGPNGAGKTTLIRMITNILAPDEGKVFLFGSNEYGQLGIETNNNYEEFKKYRTRFCTTSCPHGGRWFQGT